MKEMILILAVLCPKDRETRITFRSEILAYTSWDNHVEPIHALASKINTYLFADEIEMQSPGPLPS